MNQFLQSGRTPSGPYPVFGDAWIVFFDLLPIGEFSSDVDNDDDLVGTCGDRNIERRKILARDRKPAPFALRGPTPGAQVFCGSLARFAPFAPLLGLGSLGSGFDDLPSMLKFIVRCPRHLPNLVIAIPPCEWNLPKLVNHRS